MNKGQETGIVERLLQIRGTQFTPIENALVTEAADTIAELLEALEEASGVLCKIPAPHSPPLWWRMCNAMRKAEDAIARARGQSPAEQPETPA